MIILLKLFLAHLIGDFVLQPKSWVEEKEIKKIRSPKLYLHIALHGVLIILLLCDFRYWLFAVILMLMHGLIDITKLYLQDGKNKTKWFIGDQLAHLISIAALYWLWFRPAWNFENLLNGKEFWIYLTALIFLTKVSGIIIQELLRKWSDQIGDDDQETEASLKNAGQYIGVLERVLTFIFILIGQWEAIGFLLAAKSVFRFGDLKEAKDKKLTEYILIGTLLSFGVAIGAGIFVKYLLAIN